MSFTDLLGTDDGLTEHYNRGLNNNPTPGHIAFNGIGRVGVRYDASASGLDTSVKSVWVFFRKFGNPTGNITIGIRKASDDSLVTIKTWDIAALGPAGTELSFAVRNRSNIYQMVEGDLVSVGFSSSATDVCCGQV